MELNEDILGNDARDRDGERLGEISSLWVDDDSGRTEFVGFRPDWADRQEVLAPAADARPAEDDASVLLPYDRAFLERAPRFDRRRTIDDAGEQELRRFYGLPPAVGRLPGAEGAAGEGEIAEIPLHEERLAVGKREVETGALRLRKVVRTEPVDEEIELRSEHVEVERLPPGELRETGGGLGRPFEEGEMTIVEHGEEPVVEKRTDVVGGVRATREIERREADVHGEVRREDVEIDREREGPL